MPAKYLLTLLKYWYTTGSQTPYLEFHKKKQHLSIQIFITFFFSLHDKSSGSETWVSLFVALQSRILNIFLIKLVGHTVRHISVRCCSYFILVFLAALLDILENGILWISLFYFKNKVFEITVLYFRWKQCLSFL